MKLFHITLADNLESINKMGIMPELSTGKHKRSWFVDREAVLWGLSHISARHRVTVARLVVCEAHIPSNFYTKWITPGVYYTRVIIRPEVYWGYEAFVTPEIPDRKGEAQPKLEI